MDLGTIIDVDKITAELGGNGLAGDKAALTKNRECISRNVSFTQKTTLSGYKTEATAKQVKELGYHIRMFYIGLDTLDESLSKIQNRVRSAVTIFQRMTFPGVSLPDGMLLPRYSPTAMKLNFMTMAMAL